MSLKSQNPTRYAPLSHPGDAFAYDIYSQVGRLIKNAERNGVLGEFSVQHVVALGESQSALFLTTYVNAVDPLAQIYDGFLVHSRFGPAAPLDGVSIFEDPQANTPQAIRFRADLRVPLVSVITETDLFGGVRHGYHFARQPDNQWLRVWEIPGTAHADNYTIQVAPIDNGSAPLDDIVAAYAPTNMLMGQELGHYINFAPQHHYVLQAAVAALHTWVRTGEPAPTAPPIEVRESDPPQPDSGFQRPRPRRRPDAVGGRADRTDIRFRRRGEHYGHALRFGRTLRRRHVGPALPGRERGVPRKIHGGTG